MFVHSAISSSTLKSMDAEAYKELMVKTGGNPPEVLYFNKGL